jgi:hypothetical protein
MCIQTLYLFSTCILKNLTAPFITLPSRAALRATVPEASCSGQIGTQGTVQASAESRTSMRSDCRRFVDFPSPLQVPDFPTVKQYRSVCCPFGTLPCPSRSDLYVLVVHLRRFLGYTSTIRPCPPCLLHYLKVDPPVRSIFCHSEQLSVDAIGELQNLNIL